MLPLAVKGEKPVSSAVLSALASGNIKPFSRVIIYRKHKDIFVPTVVDNVLGYDTSEDRQLGASSLSLTASNKDGLYSYGNIHSPYNTLVINDLQTVDVNLESGNFDDTVYGSGQISIVSGKEHGTWTSPVINGGTDFHSWSSISWDTYPDIYIRDWTYYSSINVLVRYGESTNIEDGTWTPWQKIKTISGSLESTMVDFPLLSNKRFIQLQFRLYTAYDTYGSPVVNLVTLKKQSTKSDSISIPNKPLYYYGNRITVEECVICDNGELEWFNRFNGIIDTVTPAHTTQGFGLSCTALDNMKICLNDVIEKPNPNVEGDTIFEPNKQEYYRSFLLFPIRTLNLVKVTPPGIDFDEDGKIDVPVTSVDDGFVYSIPYNPYSFKNNGPIRGFENSTGPKSDTRGDHKLIPWVSRPDVLVYVNGEHKRDGYDIDYEKGVVYFTEKPPNNANVSVSFSWYDMDTNLLEDVLGEILALAIEKFGYKKPIKTRHDGYDIWSHPSHNIKIILEHSSPRTTIPPTGFYIDEKKTYFDALEEVLKYAAPDYILRATADGYFVGEYLPQMSPHIPDERDMIYSLSLVGSMDAPVSEEDIYTKCIVRGVLPSTRNLASGRIPTSLISAGIKYSKPSSDRYNYHNLRDLVNGNLESNVGWLFEKKPNLPIEMLKFTLKEPINLGAINILVGDGAGHPGKGSGNKWGQVNLNGFGIGVEVSPNDKDWYTLTEHDFTGSSGEWIRIDKGSFLPDIKALKVKYIKLIATSAPFSERGANGFLFWGKVYQEAWCWALRQVQIFPDEEIRLDVDVEDLIEVLIKNQPPDVADKITQNLLGVKQRVGTKTTVLPVDGSLKDEQMLRSRGLDYLYETIRNLYTSNVEVVYAPHIRMGHTVMLENPYLLDSTVYHNLYYVDAVRTAMNGNSPSTHLSLVNWV